MDLNNLREQLKLDSNLFDVRLFEIAGTPITVATVVLFVLIVLASFWISWVIQRAIAKAVRLRGVTDEGTIAAMRRLAHYLVLLIGISIGLQTIGVHLGALFAAGAVFAIGLGFAMQNLVQNFVSGVILLLERTIKPKDVLMVDGVVVRVMRMQMRSTLVRTRDEEEMIVPNSTLVQSTVTNYTLRDSLYRLRASVGVIYGSDMALVRRTLEETARAVEWRSEDRDPVVLLRDFADSAVVWEVSLWIHDPWESRTRQAILNEAIWWALKRQDIVIAFPQLDVHFDPPVVESLEALRRAG